MTTTTPHCFKTQCRRVIQYMLQGFDRLDELQILDDQRSSGASSVASSTTRLLPAFMNEWSTEGPHLREDLKWFISIGENENDEPKDFEPLPSKYADDENSDTPINRHASNWTWHKAKGNETVRPEMKYAFPSTISDCCGYRWLTYGW